MDQKNNNSTNSTNLRDFLIIIFVVIIIGMLFLSPTVVKHISPPDYSTSPIQTISRSQTLNQQKPNPEETTELPSPKLEIKIPIFSPYNNRLAAPYPGKSGIHLYNGRDTITLPVYEFRRYYKFTINPGLQLFTKIPHGSGVKIIVCGRGYIDESLSCETKICKIIGRPNKIKLFEYGLNDHRVVWFDPIQVQSNSNNEIDHQRAKILESEEAYSFNPDTPLESGYYWFTIVFMTHGDLGHWKIVYFKIE